MFPTPKLRRLSLIWGLLAVLLFLVFLTISSGRKELQEKYVKGVQDRGGDIVRHKVEFLSDENNRNNRPQGFSEEVTAMQKRRHQILKQECKKIETETEDITQSWHLIVNEKHSTLYCYIPKIGCSMWKGVMMILNGYNKSKLHEIPMRATSDLLSSPHPLIRPLKHYPRERAEFFLRNFTKFMFVREPLERILSAYRDKLQRNGPFINRYADGILKKYRKNPSKIDFEKKKVTFSEFVQYLIDLKPSERDEHWQSYNNLCHVCDLNYDFLGHYETLGQDSKNVLKLMNAENEIKFPEIIPSNTTELLLKYYSELEPKLVKRLYAVYREDFELFDYSFPGRLDSLFYEKLENELKQ